MKQNNLGKITWLILLLLLLVALTVMPAAAQGPEGEEDVEAQFATWNAVLWNPVGPMDVPLGGTSVNRVYIDGAEQVYGFELVIGYDAGVLTPGTIEPGELLPGIPGVDYLWQPVPTTPPACAAGAIPAGIRIIVSYYRDGAGPIEGTGNLVEIPWQAAGLPGPTPVCLDATSQVVDQRGSGTFLAPIVTLLNVVGPNQFRVGLQGGQLSDNVPLFAVNTTTVTVNGPFCPDANGPLNEWSCLVLPPAPYNVVVQRPGYLNVSVSFATASDVRTIYMLAGDLDGNNQINILDLVQMVGLMGTPVGASAMAERADYTGFGVWPNPAPDGVINISDLVLVARNFGRSGPTDGTLPAPDF